MTNREQHVLSVLEGYEKACQIELDDYVSEHGGDWQKLYAALDTGYLTCTWQLSGAEGALAVARLALGV